MTVFLATQKTNPQIASLFCIVRISRPEAGVLQIGRIAQQDHLRRILVPHHFPKVGNGVVERVLRHNEFVSKPVALIKDKVGTR